MLGLLIAWVLVRYTFPGRRLLDALVDLPLALPTAVAGLVYSSPVRRERLARAVPGAARHQGGVHAARPSCWSLTFIGLPFVVRTVQPVLEDIDPETEEAAGSLGATPLADVSPRDPAGAVSGARHRFRAGASRAALGEYGSVVFVSGNMPYRTEIAPVLIVARLEEFAYAEATAIAAVLLVISFAMLITINLLERWSRPHGA